MSSSRQPAPRLLILSFVFAPEGVSTAQLMTELATDLRRQGWDVSVVTTRPHRNRDVVAEQRQPLHVVWPGLLWRSEIDGVRVYHTWVSPQTGGILSRMLGWAAFHALACIAALRFVRRADVIFVPSPLLTLGAVGHVLCTPLRGRLVYNVQELYPDVAVELGMIRNRVVVRALQWLERYVYRRSAAVTSITEGIRAAVIRRGVAPARAPMIPNFVDVSELRPAGKRNAFSEQHGWTDRFVVLYAGNISYAQGLDVLVDAARSLVHDPEVLVAFVGGEGPVKDQLAAKAAAMGLSNVVFLPHQPYALVPSIYAAADVCVVSLVGEILIGALPSKVFRIMACERPILALCDPAADLAKLVRDVDAGVVCAPGDPAAVARAVGELKAHPDLAAAMASRGRAYALSEVSREVVTRRYDDLFRGIAAP